MYQGLALYEEVTAILDSPHWVELGSIVRISKTCLQLHEMAYRVQGCRLSHLHIVFEGKGAGVGLWKL